MILQEGPLNGVDHGRVPDVNFDHTSIAVDNLDDWTRVLVDTLGAIPLEESESPEFRYRLFATGPQGRDSRLELIAPAESPQAGFVEDFLRRHGMGTHHLTFTVPDVEEWARRVERVAALSVVGTNLTDPRWREIFIRPDQVHGALIQLADSASPPAGMTAPSVNLRHLPDRSRLGLRATTMYSSNMTISRRLFGDVLQGCVEKVADGCDFRWQWGTLRVRPRTVPGIGPLELNSETDPGLSIGSAMFVRGALPSDASFTPPPGGARLRPPTVTPVR